MFMYRTQSRRRKPLLFLAAMAVGAVALTGLGARPAAAAPATPTVQAQPVGNGLYIRGTTNVNSSWQIQVSTKAPAGSPPSFGSSVQGSASSSFNYTTFSSTFFNLTPNTTYNYIVKATDAGGQSSYRTGTVKTNKRGVTVTFNKIRVSKGGDPEWYRGDGDFHFNFAINNCWEENWYSGFRSIDDGGSYSPNRTKSFASHNQDKLALAVHAIEEDNNDLFPFEFNPIFTRRSGCSDTPLYPQTASGDWGDSSRAVRYYDLNYEFDHVQAAHTEHLTFESLAQGKIRYKVEVTLVFSYYA